MCPSHVLPHALLRLALRARLSKPVQRASVLDAMRQVMLSAQNEEMVKRVSKNGFLAGSDADYDFVRRAMQRSRDF